MCSICEGTLTSLVGAEAEPRAKHVTEEGRVKARIEADDAAPPYRSSGRLQHT